MTRSTSRRAAPERSEARHPRRVASLAAFDWNSRAGEMGREAYSTTAKLGTTGVQAADELLAARLGALRVESDRT